MKFPIYCCAVVLGFCLPQWAEAQISEVRVGISQFDEGITGIDWAVDFADEKSIGLNGEVIFEEPEFLKWALSPQPYVGGMVNLEGKTSYVGAGLLWRQSIGDRIYADFGLGAVIHDGTLDIPRGTPDRFPRILNEIEFGSRVLFRPQLTAGYRINDEWAGEVFFEHLSHGTLLDDSDNDGVDIVGARVAKRF